MTTTTCHIANRAPKGGMVSSVNGRFYLGGQFMPMVAEALEVRPTPLKGSYRQVAWANRLRAELLAATEARLAELLTGMATVRRGFRPFFQSEAAKVAIKRHRMMVETSAAAWIDARMAAAMFAG